MSLTREPSGRSVGIGQSAEVTRSHDSWSRRQFLSILESFRIDALELILPEGGQVRFGEHPREPQPARIEIRKERAFRRIITDGEIGFGEGFVAGDWESPDVARLIRFFIRNLEHNPALAGSRSRRLLFDIFSVGNRWRHRVRKNSRRGSRENIARHYDLSNAFYGLWLDPSWTYSSAWFEYPEQDLADAQENKYRRMASRLDLRPGQRVLEIGCGWGGCALYLARHFNVHVTGITVSRLQYEKARQRVREAGLEERVDIRFCDYRDMRGEFDAIVSIEMIEAVGHAYLRPFFAQCHRLLTRTGRLGLQAILSPDAYYDRSRRSTDWIKKHIFPGGQLPSIAAINAAVNATGNLNLLQLESFGQHYARTLRLWHRRFNAQLDHVRALGFEPTFIRKWNYYLSYCEAAFATAHINVAQMVYARPDAEPVC